MKFRDLLLLLEDDGDDDPPQVPGDTEGIEPGETGMPRGQGYPNAKYDIDKVIYLGYINGVTREQIRQYDEKYARQLKDFIKTKTPWLVPYEGYSYDYLSTVSDINNFVVNAGNRFRYWLDSDLSLDVFRDNPELDKERKQKILDIVEMYPDAVAQLDKLQEYLSYVEKDNPENPETQSNYPLFVSLYDRTRSLGGHEEGGWWYDVDKLVESKKVNDFKQAENAARYLYNKLDNMDLDGQPAILLEKISGGEDTTKNPAPVYESKYTSVAKQVVALLQPNVYRPGDEMVRFTFEYSTGDEIDIEDFVANDIVQAPSNLVYTGIDYFFVRKSHPVVKSDVYYCKDPLVIETQKLFNQGLSVGEGAITEDVWEEYAGKIDYFYRYYVIENKDEEINESKYIKVAKFVLASFQPDTYRPGSEILKLDFKHSTPNSTFSVEDLLYNDIVKAPDNLVYTGIDYFFVQKSHQDKKSNVYYCTSPDIIEAQKIMNQDGFDDFDNDPLFNVYIKSIKKFYYNFVKKDRYLNESKYAKAAKQVIDNAVPPKEPVKHIEVKMETSGMFPRVSRERISVIPSTGRLVIKGVYIDTAPSLGREDRERQYGDERGLDENSFYTLYITKPEYIKIFFDYAFAVDGYGHFNYPEAQELLHNIYDILKLTGHSYPELPP